MNNREERPRGVILKKVNLDDLADAALTYCRDNYPDAEWESVRVGWGPWAVGTAPNGVFYAINVEGVGYDVNNAKEGFSIPCYGKWIENGQTFSSMTPTVVAKFTEEQLSERATEDIDLADLVRVFGDRLEVNFGIWHGIFTGRE